MIRQNGSDTVSKIKITDSEPNDINSQVGIILIAASGILL
jgi:hypothetical protein